MRPAAFLALAAMGLAGCATTNAFDTYDVNADACLDRNEMVEARLADRTWTAGATGRISDADFQRDLDAFGVFRAYDADADGYIVADELGAWGTDLGDYEPWDLNDDDRIASSELYGGLYDTWDLNEDGFIDPDEANRGYFAMWDADRDGCWDVNEYESSLAGTGV